MFQIVDMEMYKEYCGLSHEFSLPIEEIQQLLERSHKVVNMITGGHIENETVYMVILTPKQRDYFIQAIFAQTAFMERNGGVKYLQDTVSYISPLAQAYIEKSGLMVQKIYDGRVKSDEKP